jgi:hypothetical protein
VSRQLGAGLYEVVEGRRARRMIPEWLRPTDWESAVNAVRAHCVRIETPSGYGAGFVTVYSRDKAMCGIATAARVVSRADANNQPIRIGNEATATPRLLLCHQRQIFLDEQNDSAIIVFEKGDLRLPEHLMTPSQWILIQKEWASPAAKRYFLYVRLSTIYSRIRTTLRNGKTSAMDTLNEPINSFSEEIQRKEIDRGAQRVFEEFIMPDFPMNSSEYSVFEWRAFWISTLYGIGCLMISTGVWKASVIWVITFILQLLPLGRRHIERIGFLFIGAAITMWTNILFLKDLFVKVCSLPT